MQTSDTKTWAGRSVEAMLQRQIRQRGSVPRKRRGRGKRRHKDLPANRHRTAAADAA